MNAKTRPTGPSAYLQTPGFWAARINSQRKENLPLHQIIYRTSGHDWGKIQNSTRKILQRHMKDHQKILDVGCGIGSVYEALPSKNIDYLGIDLSPELIEVARKSYPEGEFKVGDILVETQNYSDKYFEVVVLRNVESAIRYLGEGVLANLKKELLRISNNLIIQEYKGDFYTLIRDKSGEEQMEIPRN